MANLYPLSLLYMHLLISEGMTAHPRWRSHSDLQRARLDEIRSINMINLSTGSPMPLTNYDVSCLRRIYSLTTAWWRNWLRDREIVSNLLSIYNTRIVCQKKTTSNYVFTFPQLLAWRPSLRKSSKKCEEAPLTTVV